MVTKTYVEIESIKELLHDHCCLYLNCACENCEDKHSYRCEYNIMLKILDRIGVDFVDENGRKYICID